MQFQIFRLCHLIRQFQAHVSRDRMASPKIASSETLGWESMSGRKSSIVRTDRQRTWWRVGPLLEAAP